MTRKVLANACFHSPMGVGTCDVSVLSIDDDILWVRPLPATASWQRGLCDRVVGFSMQDFQRKSRGKELAGRSTLLVSRIVAARVVDFCFQDFKRKFAVKFSGK